MGHGAAVSDPRPGWLIRAMEICARSIRELRRLGVRHIYLCNLPTASAPAVLKRLKQYNGFAEECTNKEILDAILLLARTEGVFTEPAGGVAVAILKKLVEEGKIDKNETTICYVTGNGLKATEPLMQVLQKPKVMQADVAKISAVIR